MLIGELSIKSGFSKDTIRYYEKFGLITTGRKERRLNNYKEYSEKTLIRLKTIKRMKGYGFTLNDISEMLELIEVEEATCTTLITTASKKISMIEHTINELKNAQKLLSESVKQCVTCCKKGSQTEVNCSVLVADLLAPMP